MGGGHLFEGDILSGDYSINFSILISLAALLDLILQLFC